MCYLNSAAGVCEQLPPDGLHSLLIQALCAPNLSIPPACASGSCQVDRCPLCCLP